MPHDGDDLQTAAQIGAGEAVEREHAAHTAIYVHAPGGRGRAGSTQGPDGRS